MPYPIEDKLVIACASSALFDLTESDAVFRERGAAEYRAYQRQHLDDTLPKGVAFPFIRRFLQLNNRLPAQQPVEVVLLSRNDPETGLRVFRSIQHYGLAISRAAFMGGKSPFPYIPAFNVSLFLSANPEDTRQAIAAGFAAGTVLPSPIDDREEDWELRVAFDFDGVLADDEAENVFQHGDLQAFHQHEARHAQIPHHPGPLSELFRKLAFLQSLERQQCQVQANYQRMLRTSIITARSAPAHERVVTTLRQWGVSADDTFFLGGMAKHRILEILAPHIFFDDQPTHLTMPTPTVPMVHIPFGIANRAH